MKPAACLVLAFVVASFAAPVAAAPRPPVIVDELTTNARGSIRSASRLMTFRSAGCWQRAPGLRAIGPTGSASARGRGRCTCGTRAASRPCSNGWRHAPEARCRSAPIPNRPSKRAGAFVASTSCPWTAVSLGPW